VTRRTLLLSWPVLTWAGPVEEYSHWIGPCAAPSCQPYDADLARWSLAAWAAAADGRLRFRPENNSERARLRFFWIAGRSGLYGEARPILVDGRPGAEIHVRPDLSELGKEIAAEGARDPLFRDAIVYLTCLHESGHALGLRHTADFGDIMYSFQFGGDILEYFRRYRRALRRREDIRRQSGISANDRQQLRAVLVRPDSSRD
jgi:hypothetical protein